MRVRTQEQAGGGADTTASSASSVVPGRRGVGPSVIAAAVACAAIVIAAIATFGSGSPRIHSTSSATWPVGHFSKPEVAAADAPVAWIDGLATGLILPSDVTTRLAARDPEMGEVVMAAWTRLDRSGDGTRLERAIGWVNGLAVGLILPSDVTSRLAAQDPEMGEAVMAAWSLLNTDRSGER